MNEHGVAEGEEAVPLLHRLPVGIQNVLTSRQSRHQHDERGFRQVKVGDERVRDLEAVAGIDENTLSVNVNRLRKRLAAAGLEDFIAIKFGVGYLIGD